MKTELLHKLYEAAPILSALAETLLAKGYLTRTELQTVSRKIQKYRKQWE